MLGYIGYIRVSTVKQGTKGVSLQEQRDGISRISERNNLPVTIWLTEMVTAAKQGRPVFNHALKLLRTGKAKGIILHKLDRGARNLRDWAAIGELSDQGIEVHFVTENMDLQTRGGRLSADIQAVVAADYIRNLREETRKGFYCHRAEQNRPEVSDSKPATLRCGIHIISVFSIKGFLLRVKTSRTG